MPRKPTKKSKKSNGFAYEFPRTKAPKPKKSPAKRMKPTPTRDEGRKLEEIRSRCERWAKTYINSSGPENIFPNQILKILQKNKGKTT